MSHLQALTIKSNGGLLRVLSCPIKVCTPILDKSKGPDKITDDVLGIWDTGASGSVITQAVVDKLQLQPVSFTLVNTASEENVKSPVYLVDFVLPNGVVLQGLRVTLGKLANAQVLIGMDVINVGDLSITNNKNCTVMTFGVPSTREIDYVKELQPSQGQVVQLSRQQRRQQEREQQKANKKSAK
ncbi:MAG TPA: retroviral-like aspartic protease family protein [Candidatus Saccharimonadales bacterium]|nr:retroviral-like aspartic protease family protein [Candidatus Saccharimonadales bacterium]